MSDARLFPATAMPDWDWWRTLWPQPDAVLAALGAEAGMTALDLCCGDGYFTAPLSRLVGPGGRVFAVDLDAAMLVRAREHVGEAGLDNCLWFEADARAIAGLLPAAVDWAVIANTFHGVPDKGGLALVVAAALAPGGRFAVVNWHARRRQETPVLGEPRGPATEMRLTPEATRSLVEPAGLVFDGVVDLPPYHYGALFRSPEA